MQKITHNNKKTLFFTFILIAVLGIISSYKMFGIKPWETIAGAIFGSGVSLVVIIFSIRAPQKHPLL